MKSSVVNIESIENNSFGTGFVIHADVRGVYILTCKHVVEDVVRPVVENVLAKVIAQGDFIDMAVLYVSKLHLEPLPLQINECGSREVDVIGFSNFNQTMTQKKHISATLYKEAIELHSKEDDLFYTVRKIQANDGFNFDRGNSGSPVICKESGNVIAMISNKEGSSIGYAIDIANLKEVWKEMPEGLLHYAQPTIEAVSGEKEESIPEPKKNPIDQTVEKKSSPLQYILTLLILIGIAFGTYTYYQEQQRQTDKYDELQRQKEKERLEQEARQRADDLARERERQRMLEEQRKAEEAAKAEERARVERERRELEAQKVVQFDLVLTNSGNNKILTIKKIREITGLGLKESKAAVDNLPSVLLKGVSEEEANRFKQQIESTGAACELRKKILLRPTR